MSINNAFLKLRRQIISCLSTLYSHEKTLDELIENDFSNHENRAWCVDVLSGVLRFKGRIDFIINQFALKKKPAGFVRKALQLAVYQILYHDQINEALVVLETVELVKQQEGVKPSQFVNALLRKISSQKESWKKIEILDNTNLSEQAQIASMEEWMWEKLVKQYGFKAAVQICNAFFDRPLIWTRHQSELEINHEHFEKGPVPLSYLSTQKGSILEREGFNEGSWIVQDLSSQIFIHGLYEKLIELKTDLSEVSVLDLCAAPGGKTIALKWLGLNMTATDISSTRLLKVKENLKRVSLDQKVEVLDFDLIENSDQKFDIILLDAPCTSSGLLRRHPELRWNKFKKDFDQTLKTQSYLIKKSISKLNKGGYLAYSVCSLFEEECKDHFKDKDVVMNWKITPDQKGSPDGMQACLVRV